MRVAASFALIFLIFGGIAPSFASSQDPLFAEMLGHWTGTGVRTDAHTGKKTQIIADVMTTPETVVLQAAIVSVNQVTETTSGQAPSHYVTEYWVAPESGSPGSYLLGEQASTGPATSSSTGVLGPDGVFRVDQELGSGYLVHSETHFKPGQSLYFERFMLGDELLSETEIQYTRVTPCVTKQKR